MSNINQSSNISVLFVTAGDRENASSRLRVYEMLPYLQECQFNTTVLPVPEKSNNKIIFPIDLLVKSLIYDVVYLQRVVLPEIFLKLLLKTADKIIFDFDDAIYTSPEGKQKEAQQVKKLNANIKLSSAVVVGSPILEEYAKQHTEITYCLPTPIPRQEYDSVRDMGSNDSTLKIGWIGYPENLKYIIGIEDQLLKILDNNDVSLRIITSEDRSFSPLSSHNAVEYRTWSPETAIKDLAETDIGIRPLNDSEWTRGKGGYTSVVQCLALGIPVVVTSTGMLPKIVNHGETGYCVETKEDWYKYLSRLLNDHDLRKEMGKQTVKSVSRKRLWTDQTAQDLSEIIVSVVKDK